MFDLIDAQTQSLSVASAGIILFIVLLFYLFLMFFVKTELQ